MYFPIQSSAYRQTEDLMLSCRTGPRTDPWGPGGDILFSYIRRPGSFFWFKTLSFIILGGFRKNEYFLGYQDFVDIFWGSSQIWTIFRGHLYAFQGLFLRSRYRIYFLGLVKFQIIFWGA